MRKIFLHNRQPWVRPTVPPHTFLESFRRVDVKPNSYVTPRLTFSILSLLRGLKFRTLGSGVASSKGRRHVWDIYVPSCKMSRQSIAPPPGYLSQDKKNKCISNTHIRRTWGPLQLCATPPPLFSRTTFPSLFAYVYLLGSRNRE